MSRIFSFSCTGFVFLFFLACSSGSQGRKGGLASADFDCSGACEHQNLSVEDIGLILTQAIQAAHYYNKPATISITDRLGNVLALYQMDNAVVESEINGQLNAKGGLEQRRVPAALVAISKAGTGAYLSSQGQAFSSRTASQIIQEHFNPGENNTSSGPLFGVQFSQLPCSDITVRNPDIDDNARSSSSKPSYSGWVGPRFLPLGLSADPGGLPIYKKGDLVGGIGIEIDGVYRLDRDLFDFDNDIEERVALHATTGFEASSKRVAPNINIGKSLRYTDLGYEDLENFSDPSQIDSSRFVAVNEFFSGSIRPGSTYGETESGIAMIERVGRPASTLVTSNGDIRYPSRSGNSLSGLELQSTEVDALLDSTFLTALRSRAAIRRPLGSHAQVSIWIVDHQGTPLGFVRTVDAPIFGIDVALQKARTAAFFSSMDAADVLEANSFHEFVLNLQSFSSDLSLKGDFAITSRAIGNLARPFLPDGIESDRFGPLSLPFPAISEASSTWSPFNTGLQYRLIETNLFKSLGLISSSTFPDSCRDGALLGRLANGIQIFPGSTPLYRGGQLIGAVGVSGDGIDQDDLIAFYGASRAGLNFAGHTDIGDTETGFLPEKNKRSDRMENSSRTFRLRYVNCPESPFVSGIEQNVCGDL